MLYFLQYFNLKKASRKTEKTELKTNLENQTDMSFPPFNMIMNSKQHYK